MAPRETGKQGHNLFTCFYFFIVGVHTVDVMLVGCLRFETVLGHLFMKQETSFLSLVNNEKLNSCRGMRTMRFCVISDLIACTRGKDELPSIGKLSMQFTFQA